MKTAANWLGWTLQGIFGFVVGVLAGLWLLSRSRSDIWSNSHLLLLFLLGSGLIGAGLAARYGDRLWMGDSYLLIPPDEPAQSNFSDWLAWFLVAAGIATCTVTVLKELKSC